MYKPSFADLDAIARKNGWYTSEDHPPLPFLAIVSNDDDEMLACDDSGAYDASPTLKLHRTTMMIHYIREDDRQAGPFQGYYFAKPYKGPVNR